MPKSSYAEPTRTAMQPVKLKPRTVVITCDKCEVTEEISIDVAVAINAGNKAERCCRVCGLSFSRCPIGGV